MSVETAADLEQQVAKKLKRLLRRQTTEHWGSVYRFRPRLLGKGFGDGKRLLQVFPINERPRYWVVRVDSKCVDDESVWEILDDIYDAIDDEFGRPDEDDLGVGDERPYFPQFNGEGVSWHLVQENSDG